jgi:hypothetical protein
MGLTEIAVGGGTVSIEASVIGPHVDAGLQVDRGKLRYRTPESSEAIGASCFDLETPVLKTCSAACISRATTTTSWRSERAQCPSSKATLLYRFSAVSPFVHCDPFIRTIRSATRSMSPLFFFGPIRSCLDRLSP